MFRHWLSRFRRGLGERAIIKTVPVSRGKHWQLVCRPSLDYLEDRTVPNVTGVVFQDYFTNGLDYTISTPLNAAGGGTIAGPIDPGVAGITVTAGQAGKLVATATTASNGTYTLALPTAGQYTIRFTNIPSPLVAGPNGNSSDNPFHFPTLSNGLVQSVSNGGTANLGVLNPGQSIGYDPQLTTTEFYVGAPGSVPSTDYGIEGYYYLAGAQPGAIPPVSTPPSPPTMSPPPPIFLNPGSSSKMPLLEVPYSATGPVSSIAWNQSTDTLYAAAYYKDFTTFPTTFTNPATGAVSALANPQGQIYAIHLNSNGTLNYVNGRPNVTLFANLDTLAPGSADYQGSGDPNFPGTSNQATDAVGEEGLGGMAISPNGSKLYVMALGNRTL
ncbi:MAG TPA: SdrD B-like domain-containing protein, partial [Gemmata sp.]|nr:SdrD B-like domain-containing protein [Gemmata sp.]